jgi:pyrimidine deaminase RibD-like protein
MTRYYNIAHKLSQESNHPKHKLGCIIVRGGAILSQAHNLAAYGRHAEQRAIQFRDLTGATLTVARENGSMSRPCVKCMPFIKEAGISRIVYKDWNGCICIEKVN